MERNLPFLFENTQPSCASSKVRCFTLLLPNVSTNYFLANQTSHQYVIVLVIKFCCALLLFTCTLFLLLSIRLSFLIILFGRHILHFICPGFAIVLFCCCYLLAVLVLSVSGDQVSQHIHK